MRVALLILILLAAGCKNSSPTDLSTPETTLKSFFKALEESRIPDELNAFVLDVMERGAFKARCKRRGCKKGNYKILKVEKMGESSAVLILDYQIIGNKGQVVMQGKNSPVSFERIGSNWGVTQFGRRRTAPPQNEPTPKAKAEDAPQKTGQDAAPSLDATADTP